MVGGLWRKIPLGYAAPKQSSVSIKITQNYMKNIKLNEGNDNMHKYF